MTLGDKYVKLMIVKGGFTMANQNNQIDLFQTLSSIYDEYLSSQDEEQKLCQKMNEEIIESKRKIKLSYQDKINRSKTNCVVLKQELENYEKLLEKYSTFDSELIGSIIEKLVTLVEGEEYFCQKVNHETYEYESTVFGRELFQVDKKIFMIVKASQKQGYYCDYNEQDNEIERLVKNGQAFLLAESKYYHKKNITFYTAHEGKLKSLVDFHQFSYVQDFIDLVVQYRFNNNLDKVSEKELFSLMNQFILSKKEIIADNYKRRALEKQEQLNQQLMEEQLRHQEELERAELENLLQNGVPSRHQDTLIDRLHEAENHSDDFHNAMSQFEISYEGDKHIARITYDEPMISSENIFISKINILSSIKDYFDDSDPDSHFHGFCDIDLVDDGLMGIVDISSLKQDFDRIINVSDAYRLLYKIDKISNQYLRVLYLPNHGKYRHKPTNIYRWMMEKKNDKQEEKNTSYKIAWDCSLETEKMLTYLKEIELLSNLDEKQLKLYKH